MDDKDVKIDFYEVGRKRAEDGFEDLYQYGRRIKDEYGRAAVHAFWTGVDSFTPPHERIDNLLGELPREDDQDVIDRYSKNR